MSKLSKVNLGIVVSTVDLALFYLLAFLDLILATKIQTLWKEWRIEEQEQHDEVDDWGELDNSNTMFPVEVKSVKLSYSVNQASEQKLLKLLVDFAQNP